MWKPLEAFVTNPEYMYILPPVGWGWLYGKENGTAYLHVVMRVLRAIQKHCCAHNRNRNWNWYDWAQQLHVCVSLKQTHTHYVGKMYVYTRSTTTPHA